MVRNHHSLLLLPAMGCDGQLWSRQVTALGQELDDIDVGDLTQDDTIAAMAARMLDSVGPRVAVAGVSLGGYVAMEMVRQAPHRVTQVAFFGSRASMTARPRTVREQGMLATAPHADPMLTPIISGPVQAMAERVGAAVFERQQRALLARPDISEAIAAIRVPALVAVGDRDRVCSVADARALHERIAGSAFHILSACGHLPPMERPGEVTALLRGWLGLH